MVSFFFIIYDKRSLKNPSIALLAHELEAKEIDESDFSINDADSMPIEEFSMITQWKLDSSFKIIINLKVSRKNVDIAAEVHIFY